MYRGVPFGGRHLPTKPVNVLQERFIFLHKTHWHEDCNTMFIRSRWFCEEARVVYHVSGSCPDLVQTPIKTIYLWSFF